MVIKVVSCKTDQLREGASLVIARTSSATSCPVSMMQRYFNMEGCLIQLISYLEVHVLCQLRKVNVCGVAVG